MTRTPTGRLQLAGDRLTLFVTRTFDAPIEEVWAAVTEPARLERWLGTWHGDPASGTVSFRMGFEGDNASYEEMEIRECDAPRTLKVTSNVGPYVWYLDVELSEADGVTTLAFSQPDVDPRGLTERGAWMGVLPRPARRRGDRRRPGGDRLRARLLPGDGGLLPRAAGLGYGVSSSMRGVRPGSGRAS